MRVRLGVCSQVETDIIADAVDRLMAKEKVVRADIRKLDERLASMARNTTMMPDPSAPATSGDPSPPATADYAPDTEEEELARVSSACVGQHRW